MNDLPDKLQNYIRSAVALQLWELGAIKVNLREPFKLTSGNYSPIYINCRRLISSAAFADLFSAAARMICEARKITFDVLAGGETAGIPFAAFLARSFGRPMVYVRKEVKGHGIASLVEGSFAKDAKVLLVEDLITDAGSKIHFLNAIRDAGGSANQVLVVFDRLQGGADALALINVQLFSVTDMKTALRVAEVAGVLGSKEIGSVKQYLRSPRKWHVKMNLPYSV